MKTKAFIRFCIAMSMIILASVFGLVYFLRADSQSTWVVRLQGERTAAQMNVPFILKIYNEPVTTANILNLVPGATLSPAIESVDPDTKMVVLKVNWLPVTSYYVTLQTPGALVNVKHINSDLFFDMGTLLGGDAIDITQGSKGIDISDFTVFASAYESVAGQGNWNPKADFDNNGMVNILDFAILYTNYGKVSPQRVP